LGKTATNQITFMKKLRADSVQGTHVIVLYYVTDCFSNSDFFADIVQDIIWWISITFIQDISQVNRCI
jgi:hypothetical protein